MGLFPSYEHFSENCDKFPVMTNSSNAPETAPPGESALAELLDPICDLAVREGVKLQTLVDLLKHGLVAAALQAIDRQRRLRSGANCPIPACPS